MAEDEGVGVVGMTVWLVAVGEGEGVGEGESLGDGV